MKFISQFFRYRGKVGKESERKRKKKLLKGRFARLFHHTRKKKKKKKKKKTRNHCSQLTEYIGLQCPHQCAPNSDHDHMHSERCIVPATAGDVALESQLARADKLCAPGSGLQR
jgi:hypothetical protein